MSEDEIDPDLARRFAWSLSADLSEPEPGPAPEPPADPAAFDRERRQAWARCRQLAEAVARVWALGAGPEQLAAMPDVLERVTTLGIGAAAMPRHQVEAIRLGRLLARWWRELPEELVEEASLALTWMDVSGHPETIELLCEAALAGSSVVTTGIVISALHQGVDRRLPRLGIRLAELLEHGPSLDVQATAARWLGNGHWPDAVPALRRALLAPALTLRAPALEALLENAPDAVTVADVQALLEDAVVHPPLPTHRLQDPEAFDYGWSYEESLVKAVRLRRPPGGVEPLIRILDHDAIYIEGDREFLDDDFALRALAAGYAERALPEVDRALRSAPKFTRLNAVKAVAELPDALARPRLLQAAADPVPEVADAAREIWGRRLGGPCPVPADAGLCPALLPASRSEAFDGRLLVLRTGTSEARKAMVAALLSYAPDPEALALLVYAAGDDHLVLLEHGQPQVPRGHREFCAALTQRFGPAAWEGVAWLAGRFPWGLGAWIRRLHGADVKAHLSPASVEALRELTAACVASDQLRRYDDSWLWVLETLGAPEALLDRLLDLASERVPRVGCHVPWRTGRLLGTFRGSARLAERLPPAVAAARAARDIVLYQRLVTVGLDAGIPGIAEDATDWLGAADLPLGSGRQESWSPLAARLLKDGWLSPTYLDDALARPGSPQLPVAAPLVPPAELLAGGPRRAALESALEAPDRDGDTAAAAACALVASGVLAVDDPRVLAILDRATPRGRAALLTHLLLRGLAFEVVRYHAASVLISGERAATHELLEVLLSQQPAGYLDLLREVYPRLEDGEIRRLIERECELPSEAERYWQDPVAEPEG